PCGRRSRAVRAPGWPWFDPRSRREGRERRVSSESLSRFATGESTTNRSQKQSVFHTPNSASKMTRFAGFSATQFRGVFSYGFYMALMSAFGAKRTSQRGREHVDETRMTQLRHWPPNLL